MHCFLQIDNDRNILKSRQLSTGVMAEVDLTLSVYGSAIKVYRPKLLHFNFDLASICESLPF